MVKTRFMSLGMSRRRRRRIFSGAVVGCALPIAGVPCNIGTRVRRDMDVMSADTTIV